MSGGDGIPGKSKLAYAISLIRRDRPKYWLTMPSKKIYVNYPACDCGIIFPSECSVDGSTLTFEFGEIAPGNGGDVSSEDGFDVDYYPQEPRVATPLTSKQRMQQLCNYERQIPEGRLRVNYSSSRTIDAFLEDLVDNPGGGDDDPVSNHRIETEMAIWRRPMWLHVQMPRQFEYT